MESDPESSREAESEYKIGFLKKLTSPAKKSENLQLGQEIKIA